jgi:hypothetical protein
MANGRDIIMFHQMFFFPITQGVIGVDVTLSLQHVLLVKSEGLNSIVYSMRQSEKVEDFFQYTAKHA